MKISHASKAIIGVGIALTVAACGSSGGAKAAKTGSTTDVGVAVPADWKSAGKVRVGIACDYPPFGFTDLSGKNAGYDAEVGRSLATYAFGDASKVSFTCVTPDNRIPYLQTKKIDLIISTLGYTAERDKTIDYSKLYFTSGVKLLVPGSSTITGWSDVHGKSIITTAGTTASTFLTNCYADSKQLLLDSTSDAVNALKASRGVAFAEDSTLLLGLSLTDSSVKVVGQDEGTTPWGLGIRQGDTTTKGYVDAVLTDMQKKDTFYKIFSTEVKSQEARDAFATNMPRPGKDVAPATEDTLSKCS